MRSYPTFGNDKLQLTQVFLTFCPVSMCLYDAILGEFKKTFSHLAFEGSAAKRLN